MFILLEIYQKCLNIIKIIHWLKLEEEVFLKNSVKAGLIVYIGMIIPGGTWQFGAF